MSSEKKDLTRIEDLGEFIHEITQEDESISENAFPSELPDLPAAETEIPTFEAESEALIFETTSDEVNFAASSADESTTFSTTTFESDSFDSNLPESEDDSSPGFSSSFEEETKTSPELESHGPSFTSAAFSEEEKTSTLISKAKEEQEPAERTSANLSWNSSSIGAPSEEVSFSKTQTIEQYTAEKSPEESYQAPETFEDLKKFSESSSFSGMATEGNPSFSVMVKNVRFIEDVNDIIIILRELNLLADSEEQTKSRLMRGTLLIPRVSEFAAIFLTHKLRRFDVDLQMGLSDEIHPPKHHEAPELGIVSKFNLLQNQHHHFQFEEARLDLSQIIVAATPTLEGYQVVRYLGVASEHKMLDGALVEDENSSDVPRHYQELAAKLKAHALKAHSNAVVGLNYQLTPIPSEFGLTGTRYRLTCTGNLVWVNKL